MKENVLVTRNLTKTYGNFTAVDGVNITIKKGSIYGLVGRNGAGKTTILRMLAGHTNSTSGEIEMFSETTEAGLNKARKRIGVMIEDPSFYPYMNAEQNLEYCRIQRGIPGGIELVRKIIKQVGLDNAGKKKFKAFSLGMKQRLGLGLAIMNNPDFLVLDEPINGLDPMGIVEIRNILLKMNEERNTTVIISSHILSELSNLATEYGFIDGGKIIEEISVKDLHDKCKECIEIRVDNTGKVAALLEEKLGCTKYEILPNNVIHIYEFIDNPSRISELIVGNGIKLNFMEIKGASLEDYFVSMVGGNDVA